MTVKGIFVSKHQGQINWYRVAEAGYRYAWIKATEGVDRVDPLYKQNVIGARAAGMDIGSLHFYSHGEPIDDQIANFKAVATAFDIGACLDVEGLNWWNRGRAARDLLQVSRAVSLTSLGSPMLYVNRDGLNLLGRWEEELALYYNLWIAAWRPLSWGPPETGLYNAVFWQHKCTSFVPGVPEEVCIDRWVATDPAYKAYVEEPQPPVQWQDLSEPERWELVQKGLVKLDILDEEGRVKD